MAAVPVISTENSVQKLTALYKKYKRSVFLIIPVLAAAAFLTFFNRTISLLLLAAAVLYQVFYLRKLRNLYLDSITRENLLHTICKKLGADAPSPKTGGDITADTIRDAELISVSEDKAKPYLCQGVTGTYQGFKVSICDATLPCFFRLVKKGRKRIHMNSGAWFHVELPHDTQQNWRFLHKDSFPTPMRLAYFEGIPELENAKIPDIRLNKDYVLYRAKEPAGQEPSQAFLDAAKKFSDYTPGHFAVSVHGSQMDVFLRDRFLALPVSVKSGPSRELLEFDPLPELKYVIQLAETLS